MEFKLYRVGKDVDYIAKYGMIYVGTMILGGEVFVTKLSRKNIEGEIKSAVEKMRSGVGS